MSFKKFIYEKDYIFKYVDPSIITFDAKKNQYWFISGSYKISLFYTEVELFPNVFFDRIQFKKRKIDENDTIIPIDFGNKMRTCLGEYVKNSPSKNFYIDSSNYYIWKFFNRNFLYTKKDDEILRENHIYNTGKQKNEKHYTFYFSSSYEVDYMIAMNLQEDFFK